MIQVCNGNGCSLVANTISILMLVTCSLCSDIAIGAPYENEGHGAVYVYHGSSRGLTNQYAQRLTPVDLGSGLGSGLRNFGRSLSGRVDVDHNEYPGLN